MSIRRSRTDEVENVEHRAPSVRSLFWNTGLNYASFIFVSLTGFILTPVILGHVGDTRMGILALTTAIGAYASVLDFGLGMSTMKAISERAHDPDPRGVSRLVSSVFGLYTLIAVAIFAVCMCALPFAPALFHIEPALEEEFRATFILAVVSVSVSFPQSIFTAVLNGMRDYATQNVFVIGHNLVTFVGSLVLLHQGHGIVALAALGLVAMLLQFALKVVVVLVRHGVRVAVRDMRRRHLGAIAGTVGPIFILNVATKVIFDTDIVVVGAVLGPAAVAVYQVALSLGTALRKVAEQLNVIILTTSAQLWAKGDRVRFRALFLEAMRITSLVMFPALAILVVVAPHFLELWVGSDMAGRSTDTLLVLAVTMVCVALHTTASQVLIAAHRHRLVATVAVCEAVANLGLSIALAHVWGTVGVAVGTLIPTFVALVTVSIAVACRTLEIRPLRLLRVLAVPAAQGAVVAGLGLALARPIVDRLGMFALVGVCGVVFLAWLAANIFGPKESRARYITVLPWR